MQNKQEVRTVGMALRAATGSEFKLEGTACSYDMLSKDLGGFREIVRRSLPCFVRKPRGLDIYAACGQLKRSGA